MADRHLTGCQRAGRVEEWRQAWFDGWTEGVIWTLSKCVRALREGGHPESVGRSVIRRVVLERASADVGARAETANPGRLMSRRRPPLESEPRSPRGTPRISDPDEG